MLFIAVSKSTNQTVLCCGNCSCEDDCWRTANCCPDKETIREEPALTCRSPLVKPILGKSRSNLGYQVIDTCPFTEINDTLVSKCISNEIHDLAGLIWVFDKQQELTYKNEYCALCHHVTHFVKWKLRVKCDKLSSTADLSPLFMLDDRCELKLEKPENTTATSFPVCLIADYNHCNQTGLWSTYDADIERSCDIYHSPYIFADWYLMPPMTYKNVFCYQCNTVETMVTNPVCVLSGDFVQVKSKQEVQSICNRF